MKNWIEKYFGQIERLNTFTKYPSIETYHAIGAKGALKDARTFSEQLPNGQMLYVQEKIDGTNARIIIGEGRYLVGSREELIFAEGDVIRNPIMGIVDTVTGPAVELCDVLCARADAAKGIYVVYGEVYGHRVGAAHKTYTQKSDRGFRIFDIAYISYDDILKLAQSPRNEISEIRRGPTTFQKFLPVGDVARVVEECGLFMAPPADLQPKEALLSFSLDGMRDYMAGLEKTFGYKSMVRLDDTGEGRVEGFILRSYDRSFIRKVRFEDYERAARASAKKTAN